MGDVSKEQILNHMTNLFEYASSRALGAGRLPMSSVWSVSRGVHGYGSHGRTESKHTRKRN